jgi:hypothetical protein
MKKYILILSLVTGFTVMSHYANAQAALLVLIFGDDAATENFHFSIDGGLNISSISNLDGSSNLGANFGLGIFIKINDKWAFVPEFKPLSKRGERGIEDLISVDEDLANELESFQSRLILNYIDIPLMFRYQLSPSFYAGAGPQVSFRTSANLITDAIVTGGLTEVEITNDLTEESSWYDLGVAIELGYMMSLGSDKRNIDIKARWNPGFVNVLDNDAISTEDYKNNTFQLIISLPFLKSEE